MLDSSQDYAIGCFCGLWFLSSMINWLKHPIRQDVEDPLLDPLASVALIAATWGPVWIRKAVLRGLNAFRGEKTQTTITDSFLELSADLDSARSLRLLHRQAKSPCGRHVCHKSSSLCSWQFSVGDLSLRMYTSMGRGKKEQLTQGTFEIKFNSKITIWEEPYYAVRN